MLGKRCVRGKQDLASSVGARLATSIKGRCLEARHMAAFDMGGGAWKEFCIAGSRLVTNVGRLCSHIGTPSCIANKQRVGKCCRAC